MPIQIRVVVPAAAAAVSDPWDSETDDVAEDNADDDVSNRNVSTSTGNLNRRKTVTTKKRKEVHRLYRPASAPVLRLRSQLSVKPCDLRINVASTYDMEDEHEYIMKTAFTAYNRHKLSEESDQSCLTSRVKDEVGLEEIVQNGPGHREDNGVRYRQDSSRVCPTLSSSSSSKSEQPSSSSSTSVVGGPRMKVFQLSLCTLRDAYGSELPPMPHTHSVPGVSYLPMSRPWSAFPSRYSAAKKGGEANECDPDIRNSGEELSPHQQQVRSTLTSLKTMDTPLSRSAAYRLRNRTTHSWSQDASATNSTLDPMTMSCPNARSLEEHMRMARTHVPRDPNPSPVIVKAKGIASPATSPGSGGGQNQRPASCYTYDGGFFLSPSNAKDYVIHPDWVSEAMTVNKVSLLERGGRSRTPAKSAAVHGSGAAAESRSSQRRARRCKSAPPPKHRNPITWS